MFPDLVRDDVFRLETQRLWLRWPRLADAPAIARYAGDREVAAMTARIPHPYPDGAAVDFVTSTVAANLVGPDLSLVMSPKASPADVIGSILLRQDGPAKMELGYWLGKPFWGEGLMTEAAQGLIDLAFTLTDTQEIGAHTRVINPASRRVLEKCGFAFVGSQLLPAPARGGMIPGHGFGLTRKTWLSLKRWRAPVLDGGRRDGCHAV